MSLCIYKVANISGLQREVRERNNYYKKQERNIHKRLIAAGGTGTRLYPPTKETNKHQIPGKEPIIFNSYGSCFQQG